MITKPTEYFMEKSPNLDIRTYHLRRRLITTPHFRPVEIEDLDEDVLKIRLIDGVAEINVEVYSVAVTKGKMFNWEEIEPHILADLGITEPALGITDSSDLSPFHKDVYRQGLAAQK